MNCSQKWPGAFTNAFTTINPWILKMSEVETLEFPIQGMDCADCTRHVQRAISGVPGVSSAEVFLTSEKAVVRMDTSQVNLQKIHEAVTGAGYSIGGESSNQGQTLLEKEYTRRVLSLFGLVFAIVLVVVVFGEWLGLFEAISSRIPSLFWMGAVLVGGFPVFRNVLRSLLKLQITSHALMTLGVIAAVIVGEWPTAAVVVIFMRVGDYAEQFTAERARRAVKDLVAMAPQIARVERDALEIEVPIAEVQEGETVIVRPGERIPVDGEVISGHATINQASITGESMPSEAGPGAKVFATSLASLGSLRIRTTHVGGDTTFGRVIKMVEEAERHRANVQRIADKFSAYYLPVVLGIALMTFLIRRDPLATAAVLVVACSCSFALATPIAMLASIGAGAKRGLLIKGGKYLEHLSQATVLLIDKTGTLTLGQPRITEVVPLEGHTEAELLSIAASVERYSEHPLAEAVRLEAFQRDLKIQDPESFESLPGMGAKANLNDKAVTIGNRRTISTVSLPPIAKNLEAQGKTLLFVVVEGVMIGFLAAADEMRPEVPEALNAVRKLGLQNIELITGDNEATAAELAQKLDLTYHANALPEDKIKVVKEYQSEGNIVVMVGDGVNDAPALAQADVGIAMGAAGSDIAIEAAHIALMQDDWNLIPEVFHIAQRTLKVVKLNIGFTMLYNLTGLTLAALGFLPPILAAAAQSLPDLGILGNSSRLLRLKRQTA
jgi:Cd2+/Zn2+-exporting ATPase/Cu+-exporting ATPase